MLALINAGVLETKRVIGHPQKKGSVFYIKCIENGICSHIKSKYVIQARGQSFNLNAHPSQLIKNLIAKKEICPNIEDKYVTGGIALESNSSYNVIRQKNKKYTISPYLSSFGPLVRYWMNENNFSQAFTDAARWVANDWKIFLLDNNIKKLNN